MKHTLILGGARSGKSAYAEKLAAMHRGRRIYLATAQARDAEMQERIKAHRQRRGEGWKLIEEPVNIAPIMAGYQDIDTFILVDCLTLWLSNLMEKNGDVESETQLLIHALTQSQATIVLVSNEVGLGIVPDNALARAFRDAAGRLNQQIATACDEVVFMAAGLPLYMKGNNSD